MTRPRRRLAPDEVKRRVRGENRTRKPLTPRLCDPRDVDLSDIVDAIAQHREALEAIGTEC
jgi:hypothetical protein